MKRVLTVGVTYTGDQIEGVEVDNLGLCRPQVDNGRAAFTLYEYDTIIINPQSFTHFLFGVAGEFSDDPHELGKLKGENVKYDIDTVFDANDRHMEMMAAIREGATVIWCMSELKRKFFYGWRETYMGYLAPELVTFIKRSNLLVKKGRRMGRFEPDKPFARYFDVLSRTGWSSCLSDPADRFVSIASTPEGYSLGGHVALTATTGWLLTPPTSQDAVNQLVRDGLGVEKAHPAQEKYHSLFLSHTAVDKPFVRRLRDDLVARGVPVWMDEAEINIGDSLTVKIEEGMKLSRFIAVVLSTRSIEAPWVRKELDIAMNREITSREVVVLPLMFEKSELPEFLKGKLYADFSNPDDYEAMLAKLLRRLRIT